jgi:DNA invertase Pin-like site-specific DNA recombinase
MANRKPAFGAGRPLLQKAAIYVRVSTHWQIDKDSLPVQRDELANYCKYALNLESYEIFEDAGYSAKNTERPAYQQMMARLRTGEFSHLVVWKIDRISRNLIDFATMYEEMKRLGVAFVSKNEQFDTSSAMGEAMLKIILVFAELERKVTSERVTAVMLSRAANGQWNGGRVAYGYSYDKESDAFAIVENEAVIVRMIFDLYEMEKSLIVVAKTLNEKGLKTRSGAAWGPVSVQGILRNPFYIGTYRYNYRDPANSKYTGSDFKPEDEWVMVENHHTPIIDRDQWERVAVILTENRRIVGNGSTYNRKNLHIFAGLLRCGNCGSNMTASPDRKRNGGWRPSVYTCSRRKRFSDCPNKYVSDVTLGPFALNYISNVMKAQKSFGASTSIETFEKKLLRGKRLSDVEHIEGAGLQEIYGALLRQKIPEVLDHSDMREAKASEHEIQEIDLLSSEKRRSERALTRLQNLFLYGESGITEKDYIIERKRIADELAAIDVRMEVLEKDSTSHFSISDNAFIEKIDYFILTHELLDKREVDYEKLIRETEPVIIKDFLNSIVQNFCIKDGQIESIRFKNGIEHRFLYKGEA